MGAAGDWPFERIVSQPCLIVLSSNRIHQDVLEGRLHDNEGFQVISAPSNDTVADLVLVDMPPPDCFNAARAVLRKWPSVNIVAIGLDDSDSTALQCCQAGICWYLTAEHDWEILLRVLREIFGGQTPCAPRIAALLIRQVGAKQISDTGLTPREVDILRCLQERRTNKEIAQHLGIRMGTVKNHVHNILTKLHVPNRDSAAIMGVGTH